MNQSLLDQAVRMVNRYGILHTVDWRCFLVGGAPSPAAIKEIVAIRAEYTRLVQSEGQTKEK